MRGDIYSPWAGRAKEYAWSACLALAPRSITPTDIDYMAECNGRFLLYEMKTEGAKIPHGQRLALERLLVTLGPKKALCVIAEHGPLDRVSVPADMRQVEVWAPLVGAPESWPNTRLPSWDGMVWASGKMSGEAMAEIHASFFHWAQGETDAMNRTVRKFMPARRQAA